MAQRLLSIVASSLRGMHGVQSVLVSELNTGRAVATSISGSMYSQPCLRNACSAAAPAQVSWRQRMHGHMPEFAAPDRADANPKTLRSPVIICAGGTQRQPRLCCECRGEGRKARVCGGKIEGIHVRGFFTRISTASRKLPSAAVQAAL